MKLKVQLRHRNLMNQVMVVHLVAQKCILRLTRIMASQWLPMVKCQAQICTVFLVRCQTMVNTTCRQAIHRHNMDIHQLVIQHQAMATRHRDRINIWAMRLMFRQLNSLILIKVLVNMLEKAT